MLLDVSNSGVLYVQTGARCTVSQVAYCYALGAVQAFLLHSYGFIPVMFGLLHRISAFLRLVSQRPFRVRPRWHLSVRVNQKKFIVLQLLLKARVVCEHMAGQVTGRTGLAIDVRHGSNDVASTEIIQLQRTQLTDVPQNC